MVCELGTYIVVSTLCIYVGNAILCVTFFFVEKDRRNLLTSCLKNVLASLESKFYKVLFFFRVWRTKFYRTFTTFLTFFGFFYFYGSVSRSKICYSAQWKNVAIPWISILSAPLTFLALNGQITHSFLKLNVMGSIGFEHTPNFMKSGNGAKLS